MHLTPTQLFNETGLPEISWMKHDFHDRYFADPFILNVDNSIIEIFAEEFIFKDNSKGTIVKLIVDLSSFQLKKRIEILKLDTHLSYPFIEKNHDKIYVYPENCRSKTWKRYLYNPIEEKLEYKDTLVNRGLIDATIFTQGNKKYVVASHSQCSASSAYIYKFNDDNSCCQLLQEEPIVTGTDKSRMAGNFFESQGRIYRPSQVCKKRYGQGITISEVENFEPIYKERIIKTIFPTSKKYNLGLHTINFDIESGLSVVDGYGYLYPFFGRLFLPLYKSIAFVYHNIRGNFK